MDTTAIRRATPADIEGIQAVGLLTWPPAYLSLTSPDYVLEHLNRWWTRDAVARQVARDLTLVAADDGEIIGTTTLGRWRGEPVIWKVYVLP